MNYAVFLFKFTLGTLFVLTLTFVTNLTFDPLWYAGGNKLADHNYAFNERTSKLNLVGDADFDCLIMGSSRVTFIKPSEMNNADCFNLAFSGAVVEELSPFLKKLQQAGMSSLDYLVIGVDGSNFFGESKFKHTLPPQIAAPPPHILESYLSMDALLFSYRLFVEDANLPRFYNSDFEVEVHQTIPVFDPTAPLQGTLQGNYYPEKFSLYEQVVNQANAKTTIFYVPPLSAWHIWDLQQKGKLEDYTSAIYQFVEQGYTIIDYSIVSPITEDRGNTYDGHHFLPSVNAMITDHLNQMMAGLTPNFTDFGVRVNSFSKDEFLATYQSRLLRFSQNAPD